MIAPWQWVSATLYVSHIIIIEYCFLVLHHIADYDYQSLNHTVTFEPSNAMSSHQCLTIEIVDDTLVESWEKFTVLVSTANSAAHLTRTSFDVYINDGRAIIKLCCL